EVLGPADPVVAVAGEDVVLPCYLKPNISAVDLRIEWLRVHSEDPLVHLYRDHEDRNENQVLSYKGRTSLFPEELKNGNISLKVKNVRGSDNGEYKCFVQSEDLYDDSSINVQIKAVGTHPMISNEGYKEGGISLVCESKGWYPQPQVVWMDSEGHSLPAGHTETHRDSMDLFILKAQRYAVDVTLDPDTAHPKLILSEDRKQVRYGDTWQNLPYKKERFNCAICVLGKEGFSSGRHYWEVQVRHKTDWDLGVVRESIDRKGDIKLSPNNGYWTICLRNGNEYTAPADSPVPLPLSVKPQKLGVYVDYEQGQVSFYNVETRFNICNFTGYKFTEKLYPYFSPFLNNNGTNSAPLIISPVIYTD
ncbi:erythroid membrane-associated protein-like, partial [Scleropages formosus]|uniref:erythroid membrane-associated protein-like n=1 Tax=Scleropages formosus TaxID=113540 RepID=UPI0010FA69AC